MSYFLPSFRQAGNTSKPDIEQPAGKKRKPVPMLSVCAEQATRGVSASTAENYRTAMRSFIQFCGRGDVRLSALNADNVRNYERWLRERGVCPNTSSCYMRSLRAIYNKAKKRQTSGGKTTFEGVFTGNEWTVKRSITTKIYENSASGAIRLFGQPLESPF